LRIFRGETDSAVENLTHAVRLSPLDPEMFRIQAGMALAHFSAGRYDSALASAEDALGNLPSLLVTVAIVAASHALAGRLEDAQKAMERLQALDPSLNLANLKDWLPIRRPEDLARFSEGLRLAGLPE
jgi:tetratricopeptide (TPR) repeat protein